MTISDQIKRAIDECRDKLTEIAKRQRKPVKSVMLAQVGLVELRDELRDEFRDDQA